MGRKLKIPMQKITSLFIVVGRLYLCSEGKYYNLKTQKIRELYVVLSKK